MEHFADRLFDAVRRVGNPVVAGIDPRVEWLPRVVVREAHYDIGAAALAAVSSFCLGVLDVLEGKVAAVKFQSAFFESLGPMGLITLHKAAQYARGLGLLVIHDGKRNDIGTTAEAYADAYLCESTDISASRRTHKPYDAMTVNPYLGSDGVRPFVDLAAARGAGLFVLVRTSNPSASEFQDLVCDGRPLYRHVAERVCSWAAPHVGAVGYSFVGAVVGATYPQELAELRVALPNVPFLVPGYGAQGGTAADVAAAFDENGLGAVVNNSRGLVFAYRVPKYRDRFGEDWQRAIEAALDDMIEDLAANTPAGRLRGAR